jgi:ubiquinone/menaquinone biosynthesis C-methylase UbiE
MGVVSGVVDGATIIDCPCGAGPALRALPVGASVRYVAADLSSSMLRRARK